jgi:hypothetical protein
MTPEQATAMIKQFRLTQYGTRGTATNQMYEVDKVVLGLPARADGNIQCENPEI